MRRLIIDGYSLLHRDPALARSLESNVRLAREQLIRKIDRLGAALAGRVELVFDGRAEGGKSPDDTSAIHVLYSPGHQTADTVIERLVHEDADPAGICVVTSDRSERETITAAGAQAMSCAAFLEKLDALSRETRRKTGTPPTGAGRFTLGDAFPR